MYVNKFLPRFRCMKFIILSFVRLCKKGRTMYFVFILYFKNICSCLCIFAKNTLLIMPIFLIFYNFLQSFDNSNNLHKKIQPRSSLRCIFAFYDSSLNNFAIPGNKSPKVDVMGSAGLKASITGPIIL